MDSIDNDDDSTCDDMDSFTLENESVEYDLDDWGYSDKLIDDDDDSGELKFRNLKDNWLEQNAQDFNNSLWW